MSDAFKDHDFDPDLADLIVDAFEAHVDVDTASRHLWAIHHEASQVFVEQGLEPAACAIHANTDETDNTAVIEALLAKARLPEDLSELEALEEAELEAAAFDDAPSFIGLSLQPQADVEDREMSAFDKIVAALSRPAKTPRQRSLGRKVLAMAGAPALSVVLMLGMSSTGLAMASQSSRPGDLLYTLKRGTEQARLAMASDESARAELHLAFANERLKELRDVGPVNPEVVASLVTEIGESLNGAADSTAEERIRRAAIEEVKHLETVAPLPVAIAIPSTLAPAPKPVPVRQILEDRQETPVPTPQVTPPTVALAEEAPSPVNEIALGEPNVKGKPVEPVKPPVDAVRATESPKPASPKPAKPSEIVAKPGDGAESPQAAVPVAPTPAAPDAGQREVVPIDVAKPAQPKPAQPKPAQPDAKSAPTPSAKPAPKPSAKPTPKGGGDESNADAGTESAPAKPKVEAPANIKPKAETQAPAETAVAETPATE